MLLFFFKDFIRTFVFIGQAAWNLFYLFNLSFIESLLVLPLSFILQIFASKYILKQEIRGKAHLLETLLVFFGLGIFLLTDSLFLFYKFISSSFWLLQSITELFLSTLEYDWGLFLKYTRQTFYLPFICLDFYEYFNIEYLNFIRINILSIFLVKRLYSPFTFIFKEDIGVFFLTETLDSLSLIFIFLVLFLSPLCIFWIWEDSIFNENIFFFCTFSCLIWALLGAFCTFNFFLFFLFFECLLIPMFLLILLFGSRHRKLKAATYLVFYTLLGSILLFFSIGLLLSEFGTTDLILLTDLLLSNKKQTIIWVFIFFGFAVKLPLFPLHLWLPEAHVEAPTIGSVILAAFLLKLGGYGLVRWVIFIFPFGSIYMMPLITVFSLLGLIYCALTAIRQLDIKKMVAYSSISHMNLGVLGIFSFTLQGLQGSIYLMIAHGVVSSGLFFLIGSLYDRYHTKNLLYIGGISTTMPSFALFIFMFSIANFSFPGTPNFIAELLILLGIVKNNFLLFLCCCLGVFFSTCFSILLINKLLFGSLKNQYNKKFQDLSRREVFVLTFLLIFSVILGFYPSFLLKFSTFYCKKTIILMLL